ncbi:MAG: nickel-binding protein [Burkholderiaceae bacterium]
MPKFVAVRSLPGITPEELQGAGARIASCAAGMQTEGCDVKWLRSFFLPETSQTHCYFEAPTLDVIVDLNQRAGLPYERLVEVAEMTPLSV